MHRWIRLTNILKSSFKNGRVSGEIIHDFIRMFRQKMFEQNNTSGSDPINDALLALHFRKGVRPQCVDEVLSAKSWFENMKG